MTNIIKKNIINLADYRKELADLDDYCSLIAEQYEAEYNEPPEDSAAAESINTKEPSSSLPG